MNSIFCLINTNKYFKKNLGCWLLLAFARKIMALTDALALVPQVHTTYASRCFSIAAPSVSNTPFWHSYLFIITHIPPSS